MARHLEQRGFRLAELMETEKAYVQDLEQCVAYVKYMRETKEESSAAAAAAAAGTETESDIIPMPEDLRNGKDRLVFGNIEAIYEWHRE